MITIRLERSAWNYDSEKPLGPPGGFGAVFAGEGSAGKVVAVKRLHVKAAEAGHRELRVAELLGGKSLSALHCLAPLEHRATPSYRCRRIRVEAPDSSIRLRSGAEWTA
jgi:hypothetical protein